MPLKSKRRPKAKKAKPLVAKPVLEEEAKVEEPKPQIQEEVKEESCATAATKNEGKPSRTSSTASLLEAEGKTQSIHQAKELSKDNRRVTFNEVP